MDFCKHSKAIADKNAFEFEIVNPEDDSTLKNMITSSGQVCSTQLLDSAIEDARNNKKTLVSAMDSVISLMEVVECEEKAAKQAKEEAARCSLDILSKVDELKQEQQRAKETNGMHARELCAQKSVLATEMKELQHRVSSLLDDGDRSLVVLDEMRKDLGLRLTSDLTKKELAVKEKLEKEASSREALAYQESQMEEVVEESKRLQQEATDISKLQEFLIDRRYVVDMLHGEISDKFGEVNLLKKEFDQAILQSQLLFSSQSCTIASSSSSLTTSRTPYEPQLEIMESCKTPQESIELVDSKVSPENNSGFLLVDSTVLSWASHIFTEHHLFPLKSPSNLENQDVNEILVTEIPLRPIRKMSQRGHIKEKFECRKCCNIMNGIKRRIAMKNLKNRAMKNRIEVLIMDAVTDYCSDDFDDSSMDAVTDYRHDGFDDSFMDAVTDYGEDDFDDSFMDAITDYKKDDFDDSFMDAVTDYEQDDFDDSFMDAVTGYGEDDFDDSKEETLNSLFIFIVILIILNFVYACC